MGMQFSVSVCHVMYIVIYIEMHILVVHSAAQILESGGNMETSKSDIYVRLYDAYSRDFVFVL